MHSEASVGRLSLYRRLLGRLFAENAKNVVSHRLAEAAGVTAAQVRRDLMSLGYSGSPKVGYDVRKLMDSIDEFLDAPTGQNVALVGVGNLGRAILAYFKDRRPKLRVAALFDNDQAKIGRLIGGVKCYDISELDTVAPAEAITIAIIAVPVEQAQSAADACTSAGITGILNFAPQVLRVPEGVYIDDIDLIMSLEKVAFFSRTSQED